MSQRMRRVNEQVKEVLAQRLVDVKDPRIGFVTVTDVRTATDLASAEVFFTTLPDDAAAVERTLEGLESATPMLRRALGQALRVRHVPELHFTHDPVPAQGRRIEQLLHEHVRGAGDDGDR